MITYTILPACYELRKHIGEATQRAGLEGCADDWCVHDSSAAGEMYCDLRIPRDGVEIRAAHVGSVCDSVKPQIVIAEAV